MKLQSVFSNLVNLLVKDEIAKILPEKLIRKISDNEIAAVSGGPEVDNTPPPA